MSTRRLQIVLDLDTGRYSGRLRSAGTDMQRFGGQMNAASGSARQLGNSFDSMGSRMSTPLQKLRDYVLILGNLRFAILNVRDIAVGWVVGLVKQSAEVERLTMLMTGLSNATSEFGKNQEAHRNLHTLFEMSRNTGYAVKELADAFVKFRAGGLDPTNGSLQSLVDATARFGGTSETMHRASIAIQQMAGKGVISMEELRQQLGEAVPTAIRDMARAMGKGIGEFVKEVSKGKVKAGPALAALFGEWERMYSGSAKRMSMTLNGQLAQLRTNVMENATIFTNLSQGVTPALRAEMEEQQRLLEAGKITTAEFKSAVEQIQSKGDGQGVYSTTIEGIKELNTALRSGEARVAIAQIGQSVNSVMTSLIGGVQHIVRWRNEYGTALRVILTGMGMIMARNIGVWFIAQFGAMGSVWTTVKAQLTAVSLSYMQLTGQITLLSDARSVEAARASHSLVLARAEQAQTAATVVAKKAQIISMRDLQASYSQNIAVLARHSVASSAALAAGRASGRYRDFETGQFISQSRAIQINDGHQKALIRTRLALSATTRALTTAEAQLLAALTAEATAANAATVAQARHAAATGIMATAARIGAASLAFLRGAFSLLLGPVGMVIMVLATLAAQLGLFTSKADAARAAADNLRQGLVDLADARKVDGQIAANNAANVRDQAIADGRVTARSGVATMGLGSTVTYTDQDREAARARIEKRNGENGQLKGALAVGKRQMVTNRTGEWGSYYQDRLSNVQGAASRQYGIDISQAERQFGEGSKQYTAAVAAARKKQDTALSAGQSKVLASAQAGLEQKGITPAEALARGRAFAELTQSINGAGKAGTDATAGIKGAGGAVDDAGKKAGGAASQLGNMAEAVAVAQAKVAGTGVHLAKFNAQLATGQLSKWTAAQISQGRALAMTNDALEDNRKNASSARQANESFDTTLAQMSGKIAELSAEIAGGEGQLERFNAEVAAGKYQGVTNARIEQMRRYLTVVEKLEGDRDWKSATNRLDKQFAKEAAGVDNLWASYKAGTMVADEGMNKIRERYADLIDAAEKYRDANGGDTSRLDEINGRIDETARDQARQDAIMVMDQWRQSHEDTMAGLMDEDAQRQINADRDYERQIQSVSWSSLSTEQRIEAERRLGDWRSAQQAKLNRENENALTSMARGWARLGQNIEQSLTNAIGTFVDGLHDGELNFKDFATGLIKQLIKIILQATIAYAILSAIGMANNSAGQKVSYGQFMRGQAGGAFGGTVDSASSIGYSTGGSGVRAPNLAIPKTTNGYAIVESPATVGSNHMGGLMGMSSQVSVPASVFAAAKKYHEGGWIGGRQLRSGEVPIVGMEKELVLTERQQELLGQRLGSGGGRGGIPKVEVNIINNSGTQLEAEQSEPDFNGREMIVNVVVEAAQKQGPLRDVLTQVAQNG